jgi:hypothetical protein
MKDKSSLQYNLVKNSYSTNAIHWIQRYITDVNNIIFFLAISIIKTPMKTQNKQRSLWN